MAAGKDERNPMSSYPILDKILSPFDVKKLPIEQLPELAGEIRQAICDQISRTGGHLAPNLGVVELTLALHHVFDFTHDRLLFDVGHQCYPHKLITGRFRSLARLRKSDGIAGFPEPTLSLPLSAGCCRSACSVHVRFTAPPRSSSTSG